MLSFGQVLARTKSFVLYLWSFSTLTTGIPGSDHPLPPMNYTADNFTMQDNQDRAAHCIEMSGC